MKNSKILKINSSIKKLIDKQNSNKLRSIQNNAVYNLRSLFINNVLEDESFKQSEYRNLFLNYLLNAERVVKGGSFLLLSLYYKKFNNINFKENNLQKDIETLHKMISLMSINEDTCNIIKNILKFSGPDGSIACQKNNNSTIKIVKKIQNKISVNICEEFRHIYFNNQDSVTKNFITICMDAYIERESEVAPLINKAIDEKKHVLIFARGYSEYFKKNIKNIMVRNNIFVYPYLVKFDNEDPFLLKDIADCLNMKTYTVENGDNITKSLIEKSKENLITVSSNSIIIINKNKKVVENINKSLNEASNEELKKYLLKRKKRMTSNTTEVLIPEHYVTLFEEIQNVIHCYNNSALSGFVEYDGYIYPKNIYKKITKLSDSLIKNIQNIAVVVKLKDKDCV